MQKVPHIRGTGREGNKAIIVGMLGSTCHGSEVFGGVNFEIKKASLTLRIECLLENIFSMGINCMSLEMLWREERKCSATVVGLDLVLALSKVQRCSLKRSFKRRLVSPMYGRSMASDTLIPTVLVSAKKHIRAVYTRENKPLLTLAAAYVSRERNYLYEYKLPGHDKPRLEKAAKVDFVPFIRGVRGLRKPRPELAAAYFLSYKRPY